MDLSVGTVATFVRTSFESLLTILADARGAEVPFCMYGLLCLCEFFSVLWTFQMAGIYAAPKFLKIKVVSQKDTDNHFSFNAQLAGSACVVRRELIGKCIL